MVSNRLTIRTASANDLDAVRRMGCESYRDHFSHVWSPAGIQSFLDSDFSTDVLRSMLGNPSKYLWLLASDSDDKMVGYAKLNWSAPDPVCGVEGVELHKIYFLKSAAGKGYGAALLEHVFECVKKRSCTRIWLDVLKSNTGAQRFYAGKGFRVVGEIPFRTDLAEIGMVVMTRDFA